MRSTILYDKRAYCGKGLTFDKQALDFETSRDFQNKNIINICSLC